MLLSQKNLKTHSSLKKVAVFTRNRTNTQLWQKVTIPFWLQKKIQHFVSITNTNNLLVESSAKWSNKSIIFPLKDFAGTPNWLNFVSYENIFQELFQIWNLFHRRNKTRTKLLMSVKQTKTYRLHCYWFKKKGSVLNCFQSENKTSNK